MKKREAAESLKNEKKRKKTEQKNKSNNPEIMFITYFFVVLFLGLLGYISFFVFSGREIVLNNAYNPRQEILANQTVRGSILSKDGEILAESKVTAEGKQTRSYPYHNLFAHVVGFSSNGRMGIESLANYNLITSNTNIGIKVSNELMDRKNPGDNVITTLDVELQKVASDALGVYKGSIIVMEPATGKILAMVSKPDFDPNEITTIWEDVVNDKTSTVLLNRATQGVYPPGSTFKIVTALEYMKENPTTYEAYHFDCKGKIQIGDSKISCYHGTKHGSEDLKKAFAKSCNSAFADIGTSLDHASFSETLQQLLFNEDLPLEFTYKKSAVTVNADTTDGSMVQIAIGQGTNQITPIHMAMITAAIANNGVLMVPHVIDQVQNDEGEIIKRNSGKEYAALMSPEESIFLTDLMTEVVEKGTGSKLSGLSYTAAGKTGSAEYNGVKEDSHAWFTGFAPVSNPQVVVTIIVEGAGSGGDYAVPIAKRIFDKYFE